MKIKGYFWKKGLDKIIQYVNKYNVEKKIVFYDDADYDEADGFTTYQCLYPSSPFPEIEDFSKSEMLYLQKHGFVFENEDKEIVNVKTLKD